MRCVLVSLAVILAVLGIKFAVAGFYYPPTPILSGTTGSIGGSLLAAGGCATGTATVTGARVGMSVNASPNTFPGTGFLDFAYVSGNDTVTVGICAILLGTPTASTYAVRVMY